MTSACLGPCSLFILLCRLSILLLQCLFVRSFIPSTITEKDHKMYSELFDQLGASGRLGNRGDNSNNANDSNEPAALVSFKAGKMDLTLAESPSAAVPNKSFQCTPNKTRGEVRLVWKNRALQWQWYDRRDRKVVDTWKVQDYAPNSTFERIVFTPEQEKAHAADRIYVWTRFPKEQQTTEEGEEEEESKEGDAAGSATPEYQMFWMQDASDEKDDELVAQVNQYLTDPTSAAPEGEADRMDITETTAGSGAALAGAEAAATNQSQVDALSSILENLGMPQAGSSDTASDTAAAAVAGAAAGTTTTSTSNTGTLLTLADLQGAMAGIQAQQAQAQPPGPPLSSIVTPAAISSLLQDEGARTRLMELLPEEQRSPEHLEENLRSPQVQQTLRSLTATLLPDSAGDLSGLYSAMANFQLEPADGQEALALGNPIQAFLDALLKKVEKEQQEEEEEEAKEEGEGKNDDEDDDL